MIMIRYLIALTLILYASVGLSAQTTGKLVGKVFDENTGEAVIVAPLFLLKGEEQIATAESDFDGNYEFANIQPGQYNIKCTPPGLPELFLNNIRIVSGQIVEIDIKFPKSEGADGGRTFTTIVVEYERPMVQVDNTTNAKTLTSEDIKKQGTRGIGDLAAQKTGVVQKDAGEATNSTGSRAASNDTYVDGVRVFGRNSIPETEIDQVQIITSGVPAEFGDVTGAITNITTKGPSSTFTGGAQLESSQFLDAYGENRLDLSFGGPILKTKLLTKDGDTLVDDKTKKAKTRTLLGYRFAATGFTVLDSRASALKTWRLKDDVLERILQNPLVSTPTGGRTTAADYLTQDDFERTLVDPNSRVSYGLFNGKLDYKPSEHLNVTAGFQSELTGGRSGGGDDRLFNYQFNSQYKQSTVRGYGRLRHTIASTVVGKGEDEKQDSTKKAKFFRNLNYELQMDYTQNNSSNLDPRFGSNLFEYGYVGKIDRSLQPVVSLVDSIPVRNVNGDTVNWDVKQGHGANFIKFDGYTANRDINPVLSAYNNLVDLSTVNSMEELEVVNGRFTTSRSTIYNLYSAPGVNGNGYGKSNSSQIRANAMMNFELVNNVDGDPMRHAIKMGGVYEQRISRSYSISPFSLWTLADQTVNDHLSFSTDRSKPVLNADGSPVTFYDEQTQRYYNKYENQIRNDEEGKPVAMSAFGANLRAVTGQSSKDWVNVHGLSPDQLNISMFEPTTLIQGRQAVMSYMGYDYLGNPLGTNVSFDDFFRDTMANGRKTRVIAPFKPIYIAGYLEDKFSYKDIIVRAGVRFESYDANTKVLKDPFSVTGYNTAKEFENAQSGYRIAQTPEYKRPTNIGDDFAVYVNENSRDASVVGYRQGEQWYDKNGTPVNSSRELGSTFIPALKGFSTAETDPQGTNYDPTQAFRDYKPTLIIMPRLSFSFPIIKDVANFYANYDVLAQRPDDGVSMATPLTYYNFRENVAAGSILPNANLASQRVVNYEVGYQQALSKFTRFKMAMIYREERNLIQTKQYQNAYPVSYSTFGNDDFSTYKGFMFEYEMRPKKRGTENTEGNFKFNLNYTLGFAEGTGSSPTSSAALATQDLKYIFPLAFDQRHTFFINADYRFKSGNAYNGPKIGKFDVLENTGLNLSLTTFSGSPYTRKSIPGSVGSLGFASGVTEGSINGARIPWTYRFDGRIDRDFTFGGKEKGEGKAKSKKINMNVYVRVQNILNTKNVLAVYSATGSPTNDGFLTMQNSPGRQLLSSYPNSFSTFYNIAMNSPFNISRPRRIFIGLVFDF